MAEPPKRTDVSTRTDKSEVNDEIAIGNRRVKICNQNFFLILTFADIIRYIERDECPP